MIKKFRPLLIKQLREDILPFWTSPEALGDPIGNFPTYRTQTGKPDVNQLHYTRMQGRQIYIYFASYYLLKDKALLTCGLKGLSHLEYLENPLGGYYAVTTADGEWLEEPISIQDQCYSVFPYAMAFRVTCNHRYLDKLWAFVDFIDKGPYCHVDGSYCDALFPDLVTEARFKTDSLNLVSVIDFLNAVLIPTILVTPESDVTADRLKILIKWCDLLVSEFYDQGIFWNDKMNRTDWRALHVDLGHTSKAYGVLLKADNILIRCGKKQRRYQEITDVYPTIAEAASDARVGWWTDFDGCATRFAHHELSWWRHILIDQTVLLYSGCYDNLTEVLDCGVAAWLNLPFVDKKRKVRGIRELLTTDGFPVTDDDEAFSKANCWKNGYHEVEHVVSFFE